MWDYMFPNAKIKHRKNKKSVTMNQRLKILMMLSVAKLLRLPIKALKSLQMHIQYLSCREQFQPVKELFQIFSAHLRHKNLHTGEN
jgi:hypothetical protein